MSGYGILLDQPIFRPVPRFRGRRSGLGQTTGVCANAAACANLGIDPTDVASRNSWMVATGNRISAANTAYQTATPGALQSGLNLTLAQSFAAAGLTDDEAACWMFIEPAYLPELIEYNQSEGCGTPAVATAAGASPLGTNYAAAAPALAASNAAIAATAATAATGSPAAFQVVTSTAGASPGAGATAAPVSGCSFALFGDTSCIGGMIGTTTAIVLGAGLVLLVWLGGKR